MRVIAANNGVGWQFVSYELSWEPSWPALQQMTLIVPTAMYELFLPRLWLMSAQPLSSFVTDYCRELVSVFTVICCCCYGMEGGEFAYLQGLNDVEDGLRNLIAHTTIRNNFIDLCGCLHCSFTSWGDRYATASYNLKSSEMCPVLKGQATTRN